MKNEDYKSGDARIDYLRAEVESEMILRDQNYVPNYPACYNEEQIAAFQNYARATREKFEAEKKLHRALIK